MPFGTPGGLGDNPIRGVPTTSRSGRTTAGGHRISNLSSGKSGGYAHKGRPMEDIPRVVRHLTDATSGIPVGMIMPLAIAVRDVTRVQGRPYNLRGHKGARVPLTAHVKKSRNPVTKAYSANRQVWGTPAGFWKIVEEGSGKHVITGRYRAGGGGRFTAKGAKSQFGKANTFKKLSRFANKGSNVNVYGYKKGESQYGWRPYVEHPGHGSIGRPWKRAKKQIPSVTTRVQNKYASDALIKAFFR